MPHSWFNKRPSVPRREKEDAARHHDVKDASIDNNRQRSAASSTGSVNITLVCEYRLGTLYVGASSVAGVRLQHVQDRYIQIDK